MGISENFLVNTKSFDPIIEALVSRSEDPEKITDDLLESMGFDNPSDLLVIHVLRGMEIINQDRTPTDLYFRMTDPQKTKDAVAEGILIGYGALFEKNFEVHKMLPGELKEELTSYFAGKKTDLIIKYITNTFQKLIAYAGFQKVEQARDKYFKSVSVSSNTDTGTSANGHSSSVISETQHEAHHNPKDVEDILFGNRKNTPAETDFEDDEGFNKGKPEEDKKDEDDVVEYKSGTDDEDYPLESEVDSSDKPSKPGTLSLSKLNTSDKRVQKAVIRRAELQYKLEYYDDALDSVEYIIKYFDESDQELLKNAVSNAVIRRVGLLKKLDKNQQLLPALNELINRFSESKREKNYNHASEALLDKAEILEENDIDRKDLLPLYNVIVRRLKDSTDPSRRDRVNDIYVKRLGLLISSDNRSELLDALNEFTDRFKDSPKHRKYLEEAMFRKAELLETMDRNEDALEAYSFFLNEFGNKEDN